VHDTYMTVVAADNAVRVDPCYEHKAGLRQVGTSNWVPQLWKEFRNIYIPSWRAWAGNSGTVLVQHETNWCEREYNRCFITCASL